MPPRIQADPTVQQQLAQRGITEKTGVFGEHQVQIGKGSPISLMKIKGDSIPYQGFHTATKVARGQEGLAQSSRNTLSTLASAGTLDAGKLLTTLKTNAEYMKRLDKTGHLSETMRQDSLWIFAPAVEKLSNAELAAVYQSFTSAEMDVLQTALRHEGRNNPKAEDARSAAAQLFDLEALVLKEMSNRVSNGKLDDFIAQERAKGDAKDDTKIAEYEAMRPRALSTQYAGATVPRPVHANDITAANLHTLANVAAQSATQREKSAASETQKLTSRGMSATPKEMGDILRGSPLTINIPTHRLLRDTSFILNPNAPMPNIFHMKEQGIISKSESYMAQRDETEKLVFPELEGHDAIADERPVYGALNTQQAQSGPAARTYGSCVIVLKPEVARRATFIADDTFFSPALKVTPERKTSFYALLDGSGLPADLVAELKDPQSPKHVALEQWLDRAAGDEHLTACYLNTPPGELSLDSNDQERFAALGLQVFGDKDATRSKVASYDNLEALLPDLNDLNGALLAHAAEKRAAGADSSIRMGLNYIEAQIHGPLIPGRDFQEIRVDLGETRNGEERAQLINRMEAFHRDTGVKVVYLTNRIDPEEIRNIARDNTFERYDNTESTRIQKNFDAGVRYFADHIRPEVERDFGNALEHIQESMREILATHNLTTLFPAQGEILRGSILDVVKHNAHTELAKFFRTPHPAQSPEDIIRHAILKAAEPILHQKAELLRTLNDMPLTPAQKEGLSYWIRSSKVKTPEELQLAVQNATEQAEALRTIAEADPPLSHENMFHILADAARRTDARTAAYASALPKNKEYGTDDKNADLNRATSLAHTLLKNGEPPLNEEQIRGLYERLNTPEMRSLLSQGQKIVLDRAVVTNPGTDYGNLNTLMRLGMFHLLNTAREAGEEFSVPIFTADASLIPESRRALLRGLAPETMARFDAAYPAYTPFPVAAHPEKMPATDAARRNFLVRHLDSYIAHERSFDRSAFTHGRGHIVRSFIFASAMCSILEKEGVSVDRNAILCGITGHDLGRQGGGRDIWEEDSARMTVERMRADFGEDAMGDDYEKELAGGTTHKSNSVEGMVLKAADSLDIGRTKELDLSRMPFLLGKNEKTMSEESKALRAKLAKEADLLQRLTNPLCEQRVELLNLDEQIATNSKASPLVLEQLMEKKRAMLEGISRKLEQEWELNAEQFVARIEKIIRDNQQLFPVLSEYYR